MPSVKPLNSDELGQKGQKHFEELCNDVKLICNPSTTRDRTGWDFIVEFRYEDDDLSTLDKRTTPISCHVQVKTVWAKNDIIKMRLSSAELLAKNPKPAFIYVFKITEALEYECAYLIHLLDSPLAAVLKRLRQEHAKGNKAVNRTSISLRPTKVGKQLAPTGAALRAEILEACGSDLHEYIRSKNAQLKNLGFESARFEGTFTLRADDVNQIAEAFLGRGTAEVIDFKVFENRFGIKLPAEDSSSANGILTITPDPADTCRVTFREDILKVSTFEAKMYFLPGPLVPEFGRRCIVKSDFFELEFFDKEGRVSVKLNTDPHATFSRSYDIETWISYARLLAMISEGRGSVMITPKKLPEMKLTIPSPLRVGPLDEIRKVQRLFAAVRSILEAAGLLKEAFRADSIWPHGREIISLNRIMENNAATGLITSSRCDEVLTPNEPVSGAIFDFVVIGDMLIAYAATTNVIATTEGNEARWKLSEIQVNEIKQLQKPDDFEGFVEPHQKFSPKFVFQRTPFVQETELE